jgi:hypothetical protein
LTAIGRRDIHDVAALLDAHHAQFMLEAEQDAEHVGVEGAGLALNGLIDGRAGLSLGAGNIDGCVERMPATTANGQLPSGPGSARRRPIPMILVSPITPDRLNLHGDQWAKSCIGDIKSTTLRKIATVGHWPLGAPAE